MSIKPKYISFSNPSQINKCQAAIYLVVLSFTIMANEFIYNFLF